MPAGHSGKENIAMRKVRGKGLRIAGLVLGIVGVTASVTAVILSACGMYQARLCKKCKKGAEFR